MSPLAQPVVSSSTNYLWLAGGTYYNGTNCIAEATATSQVAAQTNGFIGFYENTNLTVGNSYTPRQVGSLDYNGKLIVNRLALQTGVSAGAGMQHIRVASCTTAAFANAYCDTLVTWSQAFADANYTATCMADTGFAFVSNSYSKAAQSIEVRITNVPGSSAATSTTLNCIAMHD